MHKFCLSSFFTGIVILVFVAAFGEIKNQTPLAIWTAGMAVGILATKKSA